MLAEEEVRLALRAHRDGRAGVRDSLLTLAVADAGIEDQVWAERCRRWLVARRSDHLYAAFPTLSTALRDRRVVEALARVRRTFPPVRVRHMLLRADALSGPYTGIRRPASDLLDVMIGRGRRRRSARLLGLSKGRDHRSSRTTGDQAVLVLMAVFLAMALGSDDGRTRAA